MGVVVHCILNNWSDINGLAGVHYTIAYPYLYLPSTRLSVWGVLVHCILINQLSWLLHNNLSMSLLTSTYSTLVVMLYIDGGYRVCQDVVQSLVHV